MNRFYCPTCGIDVRFSDPCPVGTCPKSEAPSMRDTLVAISDALDQMGAPPMEQYEWPGRLVHRVTEHVWRVSRELDALQAGLAMADSGPNGVPPDADGEAQERRS